MGLLHLGQHQRLAHFKSWGLKRCLEALCVWVEPVNLAFTVGWSEPTVLSGETPKSVSLSFSSWAGQIPQRPSYFLPGRWSPGCPPLEAWWVGEQGSSESSIYILSQWPCLEYGSIALSWAGVPENRGTLFHPFQGINLQSFPWLGRTITQLPEAGEEVWSHNFFSHKVQTTLPILASSLHIFPEVLDAASPWAFREFCCKSYTGSHLTPQLTWTEFLRSLSHLSLSPLFLLLILAISSSNVLIFTCLLKKKSFTVESVKSQEGMKMDACVQPAILIWRPGTATFLDPVQVTR